MSQTALPLRAILHRLVALSCGLRARNPARAESARSA
jgi:hypothetical protein